MQYLPTRLPIIILQRVEEQLPPVREVMGCCVQKKELYHPILGIFMAQKIKCFLGILCYLSFSMISVFDYDFLYQ